MTLMQGARMLCRLALSGESLRDVRAIEEAREGGKMIEKAKGRLGEGGREREGVGEECDVGGGIWETIMAIKGLFWFCPKGGSF